jgi:hypothetical protein
MALQGLRFSSASAQARTFDTLNSQELPVKRPSGEPYEIRCF